MSNAQSNIDLTTQSSNNMEEEYKPMPLKYRIPISWPVIAFLILVIGSFGLWQEYNAFEAGGASSASQASSNK